MEYSFFIVHLKKCLSQPDPSERTTGICYRFDDFLSRNGVHWLDRIKLSNMLKCLFEREFGNMLYPFDGNYESYAEGDNLMDNPKRVQFIKDVLDGKYDKEPT